MGPYRDTKLVVYIRLSAKRRAYFFKSIAIQMGGVSRYFCRSIGARGWYDSPQKIFFSAGSSFFWPKTQGLDDHGKKTTNLNFLDRIVLWRYRPLRLNGPNTSPHHRARSKHASCRGLPRASGRGRPWPEICANFRPSACKESNTIVPKVLLISGERTQWAPLSLLFVGQSELTEFFAELTELAVKLSEAQWVLFSETVLSKQYSACVFPVEPQSPNGKNINLHKKWGSRRFQKECQKVRRTALFAHFLCKKCGCPHFSALFGTLSGIGGNPTFCAD